MLLQEPAESPYDLRFQLLGFPVRVSWSFWVGSLIFGFFVVQGMDQYLADREELASPGLAALYVLWGLCMLVSILIHELGHALAFWQFGIDSKIVLYHFGGLAIPRDSFGSSASYGQLSYKQDLWVALAGPLAQIGSAVLMAGLMKLAGYRVLAFYFSPLSLVLRLDVFKPLVEGDPIDSGGLLAMTVFYLIPSIAWGILNLLPVWPLDGGRITRSILLINGGNTEQSLWISLIVAGLMAVYGFSHQQTFLGLLFLSFAVTNFQMLQHSGGWRY
ncbi:MAG: site-2 protease family protein [Pirellulales bacterium]|nr:site-2 protease family protein [Pirellulales bacterium]